ncbi:Hypothetical protein PHPALM_17686 [Phytophthora palmivora]|uniref:Uncharacterized protein n=1 Tax=Phytophthora palmivora TaxID=4796 RepID=A0A2P4XLL3_9STRA|nr:Hypothetical protein PHPALM_17686 [Phytophthora palmivora]
MTSAGLLKELLLLQKMRQLEKTAEPPPKFVVGTQVSTTKPVTTAELLRSKILRSHEEKRQAHFQQLEDAVRSKILERKSRGKQVLNRSNKNLEPPLSPNSELEKRVNTITTFFHEMAVHQPKRDELHGSCAAEAAEAVAEAQLITTFGEMFNCDEDLQNALDEEKWSTDTTKVIRRRESISTNLPKIMPTEDVKGTRDQTDEGKDIPWTFEDYENTAQYIEQLMIDVATETTDHQKLQEVADVKQNHGVMKQLVASWQYTQHRVDKAATRKRLKEIEQKRRNQWMQSQHVQMYGDVASAKRGDKPERQIIILPKQRFLTQEHSLPSNAIWEVPGASNQTVLLSSGPIAAVGLMSAARPMSPRVENDISSPSKLRPQRPLQRPANMTTTERSSDTTALRSAAISRARCSFNHSR